MNARFPLLRRTLPAWHLPRPLRLAARGWPLLLLVPAWYFKHPLLFKLRGLETAVLLGLPIVVLWGSGRRLAPITRGLLLAVLPLAGAQEVLWQWQRAFVLAAGPAVRSVGRHFIVGYTDFDEVATLAEKGLIGGIYVGRRNVRQRSFAAVRDEIAALQAVRHRAGLPPLIVAADQEGGRVSHLSPPLERLPPLAALATHPARAEAARGYGAQQGAALAALGINLNLGPVVDLRPATPARHDGFSDIAVRAISDDPAVVSRVAAAYLDGLASNGVVGTLKHFPGLQRVDRDTHLRTAHLAENPDALAGDWAPFRALAGHAGSAMMLGHVTLDAIDPRRAASHSPQLIAGLLRGDWQYDGILITDDLNMGAVFDRGIGRVAGEALAAGADLVMVSYDPRQIYRALYGAAAALASGRIAGQTLRDSAARLTDFPALDPRHDSRRRQIPVLHARYADTPNRAPTLRTSEP